MFLCNYRIAGIVEHNYDNFSIDAHYLIDREEKVKYAPALFVLSTKGRVSEGLQGHAL